MNNPWQCLYTKGALPFLEPESLLSQSYKQPFHNNMLILSSEGGRIKRLYVRFAASTNFYAFLQIFCERMKEKAESPPLALSLRSFLPPALLSVAVSEGEPRIYSSFT